MEALVFPDDLGQVEKMLSMAHFADNLTQ